MTRSQLAQKLTSVHPACRGPRGGLAIWGDVEGTTESRLDDVEGFLVEAPGHTGRSSDETTGVVRRNPLRLGPLLTSQAQEVTRHRESVHPPSPPARQPVLLPLSVCLSVWTWAASPFVCSRAKHGQARLT